VATHIFIHVGRSHGDSRFLELTCREIKLAPTDRNRTCVNRHGVIESRDVDSHVSGTSQARSRGQVTLLQLHIVAPPFSVIKSRAVSDWATK